MPRTTSPLVKQPGFGRYHALIIANNNYKNLNSLSNPRSDARSISGILKSKYNFLITTLYDANYQLGADPDSSANWISNITLIDTLNITSAKHVLVVTDSCYSGTLTRSVLTQLRAGQSDNARKAY